MSEQLIRLHKDGAFLSVHPTCFAAHASNGWATAEDQSPSANDLGLAGSVLAYEAATLTAEAVEIPADWQSLHHKTRIALAKKLGWVDGEPTADQASAWIADVLVHRERAIPREDLNGLSLQEVHATLTAAGVEWDAYTSPADLLGLYELAKAEKAEG